jgi:ATP-dependent DNA helicase HFM1/MER3
MKNKSKSNKPQLDRRLEQLESLHERTNSMKMSGGQRLKLDSPEKAKGKRKRKPVPNFDIDFTDLTDGDSKAHTSQIPPDDNLNDDDDLPEPCELLKPPQQGTSSPSNYSNSELEALICNAPVDDGQYHGEPVGVVRAKHQTPTIRRSRSLSIETPPVAHIRQDTGRVTKRARLDSTRVTQITRAGVCRCIICYSCSYCLRGRKHGKVL